MVREPKSLELQNIGRRLALRRALGHAFTLTLAAPLLRYAPALALDPKVAETRVIRIGSGPTGGTDFLFGGLIANAISNPPGSRECDKGGNCGVPGLIAVAQTSAGEVENLHAVARGDMEIALSQADVASWAFAGVGAFSGQEPLANLRVIAHLFPATIHLVVRKDAKITGIADLKGKTVAIGGEGSATAATAKQVLSAYGVHWNTVKLKYLGFTAIAEALTKRSIDALFMVGGAPVLALEDLARTTPIRVVPLAGPVAVKLSQVLPFYSLGVVPAGTYGADADIETLAVGAVLIARDTMDDDLASGIARAIWHERNVALFHNGHPSGKLMDRTQAATGVTMPIHAAAARYYVSRGVPLLNDSVPPMASPPSPPGRGASLPGARS